MVDISELHDKLEKISDATKVLIVGKQMDAIGKMISAMAEAQIQNELEQKYVPSPYRTYKTDCFSWSSFLF